MIPRSNGLYRRISDNSFLRILHVDSGSRLYYSCEVSEKGKIVQWPKEAMTFDDFVSISKQYEFQFKDPFRPKVAAYRESDIQLRDRILSIVRRIVDKNEPELYFPGMRNRVIEHWRAENKNQYGVSTLYGFVEKYLACGRHDDLFLPSYGNCGLKGQDRPPGKNKLGRPRKKNDDDELILDYEDIGKIKTCFKKYYDKNNANGYRAAYTMMMALFYKGKKRFPSLDQFKYHGLKHNPPADTKKNRLGLKKYNKDEKPLTGSARRDDYGPGSEYMIDSTKDNTYLVSVKFKHQYYGRCTLYLIVDVFSGMIPGFCVTPDNASYNSAALAIYHASINKVEWLHNLGLTEFGYDDWPCDHVPGRYLSDRGPEFVGYKSESLPDNLEVTISNAPPYSPHLKGKIERAIKTILDKIAGILNGNGLVQKGEKRITRDARKDAILTHKDILKIIALEIIHYNKFHPIKGYERTEGMIRDNVPTVPIHLWNWGITQGLGSLRKYDKEELWMKLMPMDKEVTFNKEGYLFQGKRWIHTDQDGELLRERLLAGKKKGDVVTVSYNPNSIPETYLLLDGRFYSLKIKDPTHYLTYYDLIQEEKNKAEANLPYEKQEQISELDKLTAQLEIIENAEKDAKLRGSYQVKTSDAREFHRSEIQAFNKEFNAERLTNKAREQTKENEEISPGKETALKPNRVKTLMKIRNLQ